MSAPHPSSRGKLALMTHKIRPMTADDAAAVLAIYAEGIATGNATFETEPGTWADFDRKFLTPCRLVAEDASGKVVGWAVLSAFSSRFVYRGVAEDTLYVAEAVRGEGYGGALLRALIEASEREGFWMLQAQIFPENTVSIGLHRACGFREVGRRELYGLMEHGPYAGQWRSGVLLERRSEVVGV